MSRPFEVTGLDEPTVEMPTVPLREEPEPGSLLAELRAAGERQRRVKTAEFPVGGDFGSKLQIRYGVLSMSEMERYAELMGAGGLTNMGLAVDMLVACCQGLLWTSPSTGLTTELSDEKGKIKLGNRLALMMEWNDPDAPEMSPREVVEALFGGNAMLFDRHVSEVVGWMRGGSTGPGEA